MKPRVAVFDFASCEGCELQIANLEEGVLDLIGIVDVVAFREVMKEESEEYDIALVEGSVCRPIDEERLKKIRSKAKILVAFGACAHLGGVQRMGTEWTPDENKAEVYGTADPKDISDSNPYFNKPVHRPISDVVKVDAVIPGCPIDRSEFARIVTSLALGRKPSLPNYPVCVECKKNENVCVFEVGKFCLGPITRAGCNSACPNFKDGCEGCRGFLDDPQMKAHQEVLEKYDVTVDEMLARRNMYNFKKEGC